MIDMLKECGKRTGECSGEQFLSCMNETSQAETPGTTFSYYLKPETFKMKSVTLGVLAKVQK